MPRPQQPRAPASSRQAGSPAEPEPARKPVSNQPDLPAKAMDVYRRLVEAYGERPLSARREPMHELVSTMLSHRTTGHNEELAFRRMWERFGSWEAIEQADAHELAQSIAPSSFAEAKAPNIQRTLRLIREQRGSYDLSFLSELPAEEGLAWLQALPGVGVKTATLVLLFCFAKPVMPVDTHLHRVSGRVGLIGPKVSAHSAHRELLALLPPEPPLLFTFHLDMLRHGQLICRYARPQCSRCVLSDVCDYYHDPETRKY